jgi:hypothetical protein
MNKIIMTLEEIIKNIRSQAGARFWSKFSISMKNEVQNQVEEKVFTRVWRIEVQVYARVWQVKNHIERYE